MTTLEHVNVYCTVWRETVRKGGKSVWMGVKNTVFLHGIYWHSPERCRWQWAEIVAKLDKKEKRVIVKKNKISRANCLFVQQRAGRLNGLRPDSLASLWTGAVKKQPPCPQTSLEPPAWLATSTRSADKKTVAAADSQVQLQQPPAWRHVWSLGPERWSLKLPGDEWKVQN